MQLYDQVYRRLTYSVDYFIYLDIEPSVAFERIRNRSVVDSQISLDYLTQLHHRYTTHLLGDPSLRVFVVDAHQPIEHVERDVLTLIASISQAEE